MTQTWTVWQDRGDTATSPYLDWRSFRGASIGDASTDTHIADCPDFATLLDGFFANGTVPEDLNGLQAASLCPIIPQFAHNPNGATKDWLPNVQFNGDLSPDTVVGCVIDRGIALGHRRLRTADGGTRILAAWQQVADRTGLQDALPFGRQIMSDDINAALQDQALNGDVSKGIDEDAFNRAMGTDDFHNLRGHRELGRIVAHGSHITDTVAGADPFDDLDQDFCEAVRILTVNLPDRLVIGLGSENLTYFVSLGILWSVYVADQIWDQTFGQSGAEGTKGFPFVINLSFAKQAGPRDGSDDISRLVTSINADRVRRGWRPIRLIVPAGNQNQDRGHAAGTIPAGQSVILPWRVLPEDQSSNFVEIWSDDPATELKDIALRLTSPTGVKSTLAAGRPGTVMTLGDVARVYCDPVSDGQNATKLRYVICVAPTSTQEKATIVAPSGEWMIEVLNTSINAVAIRMDVQTDQSEQPESRAAQVSYFDQYSYQRHDDRGRRLGTFPYPYDYNPSYDGRMMVRRDGTMNAMGAGTSGDLVMVSGYRMMDGAPAAYSGSAARNKRPTVSYASDVSSAHLGIQSAGARDGSRVTMQGTSFATAQASRQALEWLIADPDLADLPAAFAQQALNDELANASRWRDAAPEQIGHGRAALRDQANLSRVDWPTSGGTARNV